MLGIRATIQPAMSQFHLEEQLGLSKLNRIIELLLCDSAEMPSFAPTVLSMYCDELRETGHQERT